MKVVEASHVGYLENLTTKENLKNARLELKEEIIHVRSTLELEIQELRTEVKQEIARVEAKINSARIELKIDIKHLKADINANFRIIFIIGGFVSAILTSVMDKISAIY